MHPSITTIIIYSLFFAFPPSFFILHAACSLSAPRPLTKATTPQTLKYASNWNRFHAVQYKNIKTGRAAMVPTKRYCIGVANWEVRVEGVKPSCCHCDVES